MATTSPDNIWTPDSGDQYALTQDLGANADSVQAALIRRGNLYVGTSSQRVAFTAATPGVNWQDTDGAQAKYVRTSSGWLMLGEKFYSGTSIQRTSFSTAPNGSYWQDIDGAKTLWRRDASSWVDASEGPPWILSTMAASGTSPRAAYRKVGKMVEVTGRGSKSPGSFGLFTLPQGYTPSGILRFPCVVDNSSLSSVQVDGAGTVSVGLSTSTVVDFDFRFPAA